MVTTRFRRGGVLIGLLLALRGGPSEGGEASPRTPDWRRSFVPAGWDVVDCPPAYGADAVLCAATDVTRWKVDRHSPTVSIRAPSSSCAQSEKDLVTRAAGRLSVSRRSSGRCGPSGAACTELRFHDPRPVDPVAQLVYLVCPDVGPVEVVLYAVSARVIEEFELLARQQARWRPAP